MTGRFRERSNPVKRPIYSLQKDPKMGDFEAFFHNNTLKSRFLIATLSDSEMKIFGSQNREVWLSSETLTIHREKHPEIGLEDYASIPQIIRNGEIWGGHLKRRYLLMRYADTAYRLALKTTEDESEMWVLSLVKSPKQKPPKGAVLLRESANKNAGSSGWRP